jgi:hypothetical protein
LHDVLDWQISLDYVRLAGPIGRLDWPAPLARATIEFGKPSRWSPEGGQPWRLFNLPL